MKKKCFYVGSMVLIGIAICVSVWLLLWEQKVREVQGQRLPIAARQYKGVTTENRNVTQQGQNPDKAPIPIEDMARRVKNNLMARYSEEQLANPETQKRLAVFDSPEFFEFIRDTQATGHSLRKWNDFLESQGVSVKREYPEMFRHYFPTGEPEDYDQDMRLKIAKMFLDTTPIDLTDPQAAASQRRKVIGQIIKKRGANVAWYLGRFGDEWDGPILPDQENTRRNTATEWVKAVQQNAASIVASTETAGGDALESQGSASSWDLSSVTESPAASDSEPEMPTTSDTSASVPMTDAEIEAAIEKSLTSQPREGLPNERPDTPGEIQNNLETTLQAQFSSERFERAMSTLGKYGPEEGLRRLKENDPEVAKQVERHRNKEEVSQ